MTRIHAVGQASFGLQGPLYDRMDAPWLQKKKRKKSEFVVIGCTLGYESSLFRPRVARHESTKNTCRNKAVRVPPTLPSTRRLIRPKLRASRAILRVQNAGRPSAIQRNAHRTTDTDKRWIECGSPSLGLNVRTPTQPREKAGLHALRRPFLPLIRGQHI